jgi:hypothetical protein
MRATMSVDHVAVRLQKMIFSLRGSIRRNKKIFSIYPVADKKNTSDIQPLFKKGKEVAGKKPNVIIRYG